MQHPFATAILTAITALAARELWRKSLRLLCFPSEDEQLDGGNGQRDSSPNRLQQSESAPKFVMDKREAFYAFVFSEDAVCVAHGGDATNVGKTLAQVFQNEEIEDASELHERFMRSAAAGGGWCAYSWRSSPTAVRLKGAYVVAVNLGDGRRGYAGVGYMLCPPESAGKALGLYGFVCTGDGKFIAHGGSPSFIGKTLAEVVAQTGNPTDATLLLERFTTAARLGGRTV